MTWRSRLRVNPKTIMDTVLASNRNRKLYISRAPTKAKSQEPAYSQTLNQNKIGWQRSRSRESGRQADSQTAMVDGVWSWNGEGGTRKTINRRPDKMVLDKMARTKWYGQNGTDKMVATFIDSNRFQFNWIEFLFSNHKSQISAKPKWVWNSYCKWKLDCLINWWFYRYHFVRAILSVPFCSLPFCPRTK